MEYKLNWRLIFRASDEKTARTMVADVATTVQQEFGIEVCEPFLEAPGQFDCVCVSQLLVAEGCDPAQAFEKLLDDLEAPWMLEPPQRYDTGTIDMHATFVADGEDARPLVWGHVFGRIKSVA